MVRSRISALGLALVAALGLGAGAPEPDRFDTVVIDAGHGGEDEGARGPGRLAEKELVLDVSRRLARRLREAGLRVVMTRSDDTFVPLERRTALANDARGDLFVSIHANAARTRKARGVETYFLSLEASDEAASDLAARENAAFQQVALPDDGGDALLSLLGDMMATEHLMESDEFARLAQARLAGATKSPSRGVKQAPFVVLMGLQMPAALVEIGFVTHGEEARALRSERHRERVAEALAKAVLEFGRRWDARRGAAASPGPAARGGG